MTVETFHGTMLGYDPTTGEIFSYKKGALKLKFGLLIGFFSKSSPDRLFLFASGGQRLTLEAVCYRGIVPVGLAGALHGESSLYNIQSGLWFVAAPPIDDTGIIAAARRNIAAYERFRLNPLPTSEVPAAVLSQASRLDTLLKMPLTPRLITLANAVDAAVVDAVIGAAPPEEFAEFSRQLLHDPESCERLKALYPDDIFASVGLIGVSNWLASQTRPTKEPSALGRLFSTRRTMPQPVQSASPLVGAEFDRLEDLDVAVRMRSVPHAILHQARRSVRPRQTFCIVATARNEGIYLLEWVAYYRNLGCDAIFLYTNDNDDGSDLLLAALSEAGVITWLRNSVRPGLRAQNKAYSHCFTMLPAVLDFRWALTIDLDEFLVFNADLFSNVNEYLRWHALSGITAIGVNWRFYGANSQVRWYDETMLRRFPKPSGLINQHVKCISRPNAIVTSRPHHPLAFEGDPFDMRSESGAPFQPRKDFGNSLSDIATDSFVWINHYFFKSAEEFVLKFSRNRGDFPVTNGVDFSGLSSSLLESFVDSFQPDEGNAQSALQCVPGLNDELMRLKALPGVKAALGAVHAAYKKRVEDTLAPFAACEAVKAAGDKGQKLVQWLSMS